MLLALLYQLVRYLTDLTLVRTQSDAQLRAEVLALRHQLRVLERKVGKPAWQPGDRLLVAALSRLLRRDRVRPWTPRRVRRTSVPSAASTESKAAANLTSRARTRKRGRWPRSVSSQVMLRACCVTQLESGLSVQAVKRIRRLSRWMTKST